VEDPHLEHQNILVLLLGTGDEHPLLYLFETVAEFHLGVAVEVYPN
jgi:hypothetical protein